MNQIRNSGYLGKKGISQILILIIMGVLAVALPLTTKLVQQSQETRSKATESKRTAEYCSSKTTRDACIGDPGCYYFATGGLLDSYNKGNCLPSRVRGEECPAGEKQCYEGLVCRSGYCVNSSDCVHTKTTEKVFKEGDIVCWDWDIHKCNNGDFESGVVNCDKWSTQNLDRVGCTGSHTGRCTFSNALKATPPSDSGKKAGESCSADSECSSGLFCSKCYGKCLSSVEVWDYPLSNGCDTSTGNYKCTKRTFTTNVTCGNYYFTTESACQNASGCDKGGGTTLPTCASKSGFCTNVPTCHAEGGEVVTGVSGCTGSACCVVKDTPPTVDKYKRGSCNGTKYTCTLDASGTYTSKTSCEGSCGGGGGDTGTGDKGEKCNSGVVGECITVSSSDKENSICSIPDKNIAGTLVFNKCNGGTTNRCCKVTSTCTTEGAKNGCEGTSKIINCVKDSSSGVMGYISQDCPSGQTCSGSGASAVCAAPVSPVNGACGTTNNACSAGTLSDIADSSTQYLWNCTGTNGGTTANCSLNIPATPVNGACGTTNNTCSAGTSSDVADTSTQYKWNCTGINGGSTAECSLNIPTSNNPSVGFKFAYAGIKANAKCSGNIGALKMIVGNIPNMKSQELTAIGSLVSGEVNKNGDQVFQTGLINLDGSKFDKTNTHNYVKAKGYIHARMKFCASDQTSKVADENCNMILNGTVYSFINYPILPGDVTGDTPGQQNGIINGQDYSYIKTRVLNDNGIETCGKDGDLNLDGVVNGTDIQLIKTSLGTRDDD